ncbi:MAG: metallophosphoesterase [Candidatus Eisenbacteria bacterium]|uniref:Metallophosphoesterase n=1 Tax=Eiseniibacteriota bacterium TaxID=2212470 RepID=A0A9D6L7H8_UNCEI|nr:metallophosphoesterase [Candidatus Eisenbacteria bacterium]MBI3540176.1 metallophosphoesterase [Candidatus Eisenbacteria bacterium]
MRLPRSIALATFALLLVPAAAHAYTYGDTLTTIWRPLPNLPTIARPGDVITVWADAPSTVTGWNAALQFAALTVPLSPSGGGYQATKSRWELQFTVPLGTPEELYDLSLTSNNTLPDIARTCVKVIPQIRTDYYFAQISDTHLPEHTFSSNGSINTADTTGMGDFDAVIGDLNVIHPEFIIHTGDLVNEGELEEYLGMYEMGRGGAMLSRLFSPTFVITGNHDIGGWEATPPPDGTSRKNWWRYFGWKYLLSPPAGDPWHSQDYSFDYGLLHMIGMESYINNGSYDSYMTNIWGAQSMTAEQMNWLAQDVAAVPSGHVKLAFFHYDFGGTLSNGSPAANFTQFNNPAALGLDGVFWGHNHVVAESSPAQLAAHPFNIGAQSVIYSSTAGGRTFRMFRVSSNGATVVPGIMHHSGGNSPPTSIDSLTIAWNDVNDGTRLLQTATVINHYGETWEHARLRFVMVNHDSAYAATGGTVGQVIVEGGRANVYVDCILPAGGTTVVTVSPTAPTAVGLDRANTGLPRLDAPTPDPWRAGGPLTLNFTLAKPGHVRLTLLDAQGRRAADIASLEAGAGPHTVLWSAGHLASGVYLIRLETAAGTRSRKVTLTH